MKSCVGLGLLLGLGLHIKNTIRRTSSVVVLDHSSYCGTFICLLRWPFKYSILSHLHVFLVHIMEPTLVAHQLDPRTGLTCLTPTPMSDHWALSSVLWSSTQAPQARTETCFSENTTKNSVKNDGFIMTVINNRHKFQYNTSFD